MFMVKKTGGQSESNMGQIELKYHVLGMVLREYGEGTPKATVGRVTKMLSAEGIELEYHNILKVMRDSTYAGRRVFTRAEEGHKTSYFFEPELLMALYAEAKKEYDGLVDARKKVKSPT
jgi:hypothetical protein